MSHVEPDEREAEAFLQEFSLSMAAQFPFVVIRPEETSRSLRSEKPLLWKAIMVAAAHGDSDRQLSLGSNLMEDITTHLLFRAEKSLHLLQALLVFIAWYALAALRMVHTMFSEPLALMALQVPLSYFGQSTDDKLTSSC